MVVESWLMSATDYIVIDNTPLRPGVHVDGRSGLARPDQSAGHAKLKSKNLCFVYICQEQTLRTISICCYWGVG